MTESSPEETPQGRIERRKAERAAAEAALNELGFSKPYSLRGSDVFGTTLGSNAELEVTNCQGCGAMVNLELALHPNQEDVEEGQVRQFRPWVEAHLLWHHRDRQVIESINTLWSETPQGRSARLKAEKAAMAEAQAQEAG